MPSSDSPTVVFDVPELLDLRDVKRITKVGDNQAYAIMHAAGPIKFGRSLRVRPQDLASYLDRQREEIG
jgi:hypothetical protein